MKTFALLITYFLSLASFAQTASIEELDKDRVALIVRAFNERPDQLIAPLTAESVKLKSGTGRVDVNKKAKFSYYIQVEFPDDPKSKIFLVPMATSRFTPTYYQTDEWWDAHKHEKPMPRQPMNEVAAFLDEMKLSSNPDVLIIDPSLPTTIRAPLQQYLLAFYLHKYAVDGVLTLYRGAERENETEMWEKGQRPAGVRYWTPTANYAWRYARKNLSFVEDLVNGKAPLLKFEVPVEDFKSMVDRKWPRLTLGTELTKNAHNSFDSQGRFLDHLARGADFLGEGQFGVEFEVRSNKAGADDMQKYYKGTISISELAADRIKVIQEATKRLQAQHPEEVEKLRKQADERIKTIKTEEQLLLLVQKGGPKDQINKLKSELSRSSEITNIDGFSMDHWLSTRTPSKRMCRAVHL